MSAVDSHVPPGWPSVVPRLFVEDPAEAVRFIKEVFGAEGEFNGDRPSELRIGDSLLMIGSAIERDPTFSLLYVYVPDVDAAYRKALGLGASSIELPAEMPYGDRRAMVEDPWGNQWQLAQHRRFGGAGT